MDHNMLISNRQNNYNMLEESKMEYSQILDDMEVVAGEGNLIGMKYRLNEETTNKSMVLIVDDNPFNIVAMQSLLEQFNVQSDYCNDGSEAIKIVQDRGNNSILPMYKLILMDYSMPECDGPTATAKIRNYLSNEV